MRQQISSQFVVFGLLVVLGVLGRWLQPDWNVTPMAAVALFAGWFFTDRRLALLTPAVVLAISNLRLPAYDLAGVTIAVYTMFLLPVFLGSRLREKPVGWVSDPPVSPKAARRANPITSYGPLAFCSVVPAIAFYLVTNFAVWFFGTTYPWTLVGLGQCYIAGLPFLRMMVLGDVFYVAVLFGSYSLALQLSVRRAKAVA